jgi:hypothetical protein
MFGERGIVLGLFNLIFFVQLDTRFTYRYGLFSLLCIQCPVLFCDTVLLFVTVFFCVLYCSFFLYCSVSACDVRAATINEFFFCFSSVVRQMPGYNSQKRGTARASQINFKFFYRYVCS